jgi:hypothetical protein
VPYKDPREQREYQRRWKAERRARKLKEHGPCATCGTWKELNFHHKDPAKKIEHRIWTWSEKRLEEELAKCIVLCERHHLLLHQPLAKHGTLARYQSLRDPCRCPACKEAKAAYRRRRVEAGLDYR